MIILFYATFVLERTQSFVTIEQDPGSWVQSISNIIIIIIMINNGAF